MTVRDRRAVLMGAAVVGAAFLAVRAVPAAARAMTSLRERAHDRQATLARARDLAVRIPQIRDSLALAAADLVQLAPRLLDGRSRVEAAASLTGLLSLVASRAGLKVLRLAPSGDSAQGIVQPVRAVAEMEGDAGGLTRLLAALERGDPLVTVVSLVVTAPEVAARPAAPEALRLEIEVQGWFLARSEP